MNDARLAFPESCSVFTYHTFCQSFKPCSHNACKHCIWHIEDNSCVNAQNKYWETISQFMPNKTHHPGMESSLDQE